MSSDQELGVPPMSENDMLQYRILQLERYKEEHGKWTEHSATELAQFKEWQIGVNEWRREQKEFQTKVILMLLGSWVTTAGAVVLLLIKH